MKKIAVIIVASLLLFACGPKSASRPEKKRLRIAVVTNNSSDWWTLARKGGEQAAAELGDVEFDFRSPPDPTAAAQRAVIDDLLTRGVDGLMVCPIDVENQTQMLDEVATKTLLFTLGADAPKSKRKAYVGSDDFAAGKMAGEQLRKALPNGGRAIAFVGRRDAQNAVERIDGLKSALTGSGIEIIDIRTDDSDAAKAKSNTADALVVHPDIDALIGVWSYNTPAILNALKDAGKAGRVKVIGFDEEEETLNGVAAGTVFATVVQQPFGFTSDAVRRMTLTLRGDQTQIPADGKAIFPTAVVDAAGVESFRQGLKTQRGR